MEQLAPHERVWVDKAFMTDDPIHGSFSCDECHGGNPSDGSWQTAHEGVIRDPSRERLDETCGACHSEIVKTHKTSLHATLEPYVKAIDLRSTRDRKKYQVMDQARKDHCITCHASCGECHISRPASVEGGLLDSHFFKKKPPMKETCTACHGSRVDREYFGKNEGIPPDVHRQNYFNCIKCHSGAELHGDGREYDHRYEVASAPQCVDCHESIYSDAGENVSQHLVHQNNVSCQVCHSMPYKNCYSCHVGRDSFDLKYFKTEPSEMDIKIGLNPLKSERRPETFVTVRHIPADHDLFSYYVDDALTNFDAAPTWKFATPHTIQRQTPQNSDCNNCHGNKELFLSTADVRPEYRTANRDVIVPPDMVPDRITR